MRTGVSLLFFLFIAGCKPCPCWEYQEVNTSCYQGNSALLSYPLVNPFDGIEFQLLRGSFGTLGYLNVKCRDIPLLPGSLHHAQVRFIIDGGMYVFTTVCMEGEQRLLLPDEATELLIRSFCDHRTVCISLPFHYAQIPPGQFVKLYRKFCALPIE